ncbi:helix-turn-helix domain-containing protein [Pedobacter jamesrossensis]|uniref:Helix-turn-helix domain-containing protein n=1 Tax=Pedobacter jamesrossensis TaxID=1908238 RepID=A0ABV8NPG9_9SPHI
MQQQLINNSNEVVNIDNNLPSIEDLEVSTLQNQIPSFCLNQAFRATSYAFILIIKGRLNIKTNFIQETLKEKDVLFIFPDSIYEIDNVKDISFIKVGFSKKYLTNQGISLNTAQNYRIFRTQGINKFSLNKEEYTDLYHDILALQKKLKLPLDIPQRNDIVRNSFIEILFDMILLGNKRFSLEPAKRDSKLELTTNFLNLLSEQFRKEKRVIYYANKLCITPRHLSQVVKYVTGKTAGELIDEMVIGEAKILLNNYFLNISEVSFSLGFATSSFFGKYFKKQTGISPSVYKSENRIPRTSIF